MLSASTITSQPRAVSSPMTLSSILECREDQPDMTTLTLPDHCGTLRSYETGHGIPNPVALAEAPSSYAGYVLAEEPYSSSDNSFRVSCLRSHGANLPTPETYGLIEDSRLQFSLMPHSRPPFAIINSQIWPLPFHVAQAQSVWESFGESASSASRAWSESRNKPLAQCSSRGIGISCEYTPSIAENADVRNSTSTASFNSSTSTSYSGTVLGVDLDLQYDFRHSLSHSRTPTPEVSPCLSSKMRDIECQRHSPSLPQTRQELFISSAHKLVTSSALTSLLPIATASGIIHLNCNTSKISFDSPSGNHIQAVDNSKVRAGSLAHEEILTSSNMSTDQMLFEGRGDEVNIHGLPPVRLLLAPPTTSATLSIPLPAHLRLHYDYKTSAKVDIEPCEMILENKHPVRGCDGVIKSRSLTVSCEHRQTHVQTQPCGHDRKHHSTQSILQNLRETAVDYSTRIRNSNSQFFTRLRKARKLQTSKTIGTSNLLLAESSDTRALSRINNAIQRLTTRFGSTKQGDGILGASAAHTLRICFCQP